MTQAPADASSGTFDLPHGAAVVDGGAVLGALHLSDEPNRPCGAMHDANQLNIFAALSQATHAGLFSPNREEI